MFCVCRDSCWGKVDFDQFKCTLFQFPTCYVTWAWPMHIFPLLSACIERRKYIYNRKYSQLSRLLCISCLHITIYRVFILLFNPCAAGGCLVCGRCLVIRWFDINIFRHLQLEGRQQFQSYFLKLLLHIIMTHKTSILTIRPPFLFEPKHKSEFSKMDVQIQFLRAISY